MKKIPTLFERDRATGLVIDALVSEAEWVAAGEGVATRKYDGTCCLVRDGRLFKRHEVKYVRLIYGPITYGLRAPLAAGFEPCTEVDPHTLKQQGWVPVGDGPEDKWHREAFDRQSGIGSKIAGHVIAPMDGTYELVGPKIQGNPEGCGSHCLVRHGSCVLEGAPRTFDALKSRLADGLIEGIVWWREIGNPDAGLVKIKGRDFGIRRVR